MIGATVDTGQPGRASLHVTRGAAHYPSEQTIEALACALVELGPDLFTGDDLVSAFGDWTADGALIFEGGRADVIDAAWHTLGLRNPDREAEEVADPDGWAMWSAHCALDGAVQLLTERHCRWDRAALALRNMELV